MIIWIASYPKSGNTWLRLLIQNYFQNNLYKNNPLLSLNYSKKFPSALAFEKLNFFKKNIFFKETLDINNKYLQQLSSEIKFNFIKTHTENFLKEDGNLFIDKDTTLGAIYICRDPRNVVLSEMNYNNWTLQKSYEMLKKRTYLSDIVKNVKVQHTQVGSWSDNIASWKMSSIYFPVHFIQYEKLVRNTYHEVKKILNFLKKFINFDINDNILKKTIELCSFQNLKNAELLNGFREASDNLGSNTKNFFFHKGPERDFLKELSDSEINELNQAIVEELNMFNSLSQEYIF